MDIIKSSVKLCTSSKFGGCFVLFFHSVNADFLHLEELCFRLLRSLAAVVSQKKKNPDGSSSA